MKLEDWMRAEGWSDQMLAARIDVTAETIRRYRKGERYPRWRIVHRITEVSGGKVTAGDFLPSEGAA